MSILPQSFYNRPTLQVAQDLLGCFLVRGNKNDEKNKNHNEKFEGDMNLIEGETPASRLQLNSSLIQSRLQNYCFKIVETEAYNGPNDLASHASKGRTPRNKVMFGKPGIIYIYFTYGMHYMLNIVTERKNYPAAILIRAVEPVTHNSQRITHNALKTNGPAKLTKTLNINKSFNCLPIYTKKHGLWIENCDTEIKPSQIKKTTRIGIDYAKEYKNKKWRFYLKNSKFVSKK